MHIKTAESRGVAVKYFLSKSLMYDIDTPEDALCLVKEEKNTASRSIEFLKSKFRLG